MIWSDRKTGQTSRGRRRGTVFSVRLTAEQRAQLEAEAAVTPGPRSLGQWLVWRALEAGSIDGVLPARDGTTRAQVIPRRQGTTSAASGEGITIPEGVESRVILDLCGGTGAWSAPYSAAGYDVRIVTLPEQDVTDYQPPASVHGVLAAPPCDQFSLARNGCDTPRDIAGGLRIVAACLRVIALCRPQWWALENPVGLLGETLGTPELVFQPWWYGDPWTKRTALWGRFAHPKRGPFVEPTSSAAKRSTSEQRAITPPGFARAFAEANP